MSTIIEIKQNEIMEIKGGIGGIGAAELGALLGSSLASYLAYRIGRDRSFHGYSELTKIAGLAVGGIVIQYCASWLGSFFRHLYKQV